MLRVCTGGGGGGNHAVYCELFGGTKNVSDYLNKIIYEKTKPNLTYNVSGYESSKYFTKYHFRNWCLFTFHHILPFNSWE